MKGYEVEFGYMGWIPNLRKYILFATEMDYIEYYESNFDY